MKPSEKRSASRALALAALLASAGCAVSRGVDPAAASAVPDDCQERTALEQAEARASGARIAQLEAKIRRLESDLAQAQQVIVAAESQLSGAHTRALAVRSAAEARSELESAVARAPWKHAEAQQADALLREADAHLQAGHFGAAILLAARAASIAGAIAESFDELRRAPGALQVGVARANLRAGPSTQREVLDTLVRGTPLLPEREVAGWALVRTPHNQLGWIHRSLLEPFAGSSRG